MNRSIIYKTSSFPSFSETFVVNSIVAAIDKGYHVTIVTDEKKDLKASSQPEVIKEYGLLDKVKTYREPAMKDGRRYKALSILLNPFFAFYFLKYCLAERSYSLSYLFRLKFYKAIRKAHVYHVHFAYNAADVLPLKRIGFIKARIILTFHGFDAHYLIDRPTKGVSITSINRYVDNITVNSTYLKELLDSKGIDKKLIQVVPIGVDTTYFRRSSNSESKLSSSLKLITVGRLIPLKGQHLGLEVVKSLLDRGIDVHYTVIGSGKNIERLKKSSSDLALGSRVQFLEDRTQLEIREQLKQSDIFLMTSVSDKDGRREAFGVVSLEAQAMGLPVIGFSSGGIPETLEDGKTGIIVTEGDTNAMAEAVESLISNPERYSEMSKAARQLVCEKFESSITAASYLKLYEN